MKGHFAENGFTTGQTNCLIFRALNPEPVYPKSLNQWISSESKS